MFMERADVYEIRIIRAMKNMFVLRYILLNDVEK